MKLAEYTMQHTERGECNCGRCVDRGNAPDPTGHSVSVTFFKVAATNSPKREELDRLIRQEMVFIFDGAEHSSLEVSKVSRWEHEVALRFMALGYLLGCFELLTLDRLMSFAPQEMRMAMAEAGMVTVVKR